jgi:tRNA-modifying protein YgfZ
MTGEWAADRHVLKISGADAHKFLQDMVTNDLKKLEQGLVYTAILSPQGKYLFDFFLKDAGKHLLLDVSSDRAAALAQRLTLYRLRADVQISDSGLSVQRGLGVAPPAADPDPRHPALGWRLYAKHNVADTGEDAGTDWTALHVTHCIPQTGIELIPDQTYILEAGFERLHGVDFKKGCYVGQEVTARMKHKTELRKGLVRVAVTGAAPVGTPIEADGKPVGVLFSQSHGAALAYLRFDRAGPDMRAGPATVVWQRK